MPRGAGPRTRPCRDKTSILVSNRRMKTICSYLRSCSARSGASTVVTPARYARDRVGSSAAGDEMSPDRCVDGSARSQLAADDAGAVDERAELAERDVARQLVEPAVGADDQPLRRDVLQRRPDARGHVLRALDAGAHHLDDADAQDGVLPVQPARQQ